VKDTLEWFPFYARGDAILLLWEAGFVAGAALVYELPALQQGPATGLNNKAESRGILRLRLYFDEGEQSRCHPSLARARAVMYEKTTIQALDPRYIVFWA
jgi:hypothetical protein